MILHLPLERRDCCPRFENKKRGRQHVASDIVALAFVAYAFARSCTQAHCSAGSTDSSDRNGRRAKTMGMTAAAVRAAATTPIVSLNRSATMP